MLEFIKKNINKKIIKVPLIIINDFILLIISINLALIVRYESFQIIDYHQLRYALYCYIILFLIFSYFQIFNSVNRHFGQKNFISLLICFSIYLVIVGLFTILVQINGIPRSIGIIHSIIYFIILILNRIVIHYLFSLNNMAVEKESIIIYGAGKSGFEVTNWLFNSNNYNLVGFIDDDKNKSGRHLNGVRIYNSEKLEFLISKYNVNNIILAMKFNDISKKRLILSKILKIS